MLIHTIWQQQTHKELTLLLFSFSHFLTQDIVSFSHMNIHELTLKHNAVQFNDIN